MRFAAHAEIEFILDLAENDFAATRDLPFSKERQYSWFQ